MFEKLRRAKSFIHKSKYEDEKQNYANLEFSETSHLRRNVVIDREVLEQQKNLKKISENVSDRKRTTLRRQASRSHEHLHDQVIEQLRKINFGDSYSKKHAQKLKESSEVPSAFDRRHPVCMSERNFRRRSFGAEERAKHVHRNSGDVLCKFERKNPACRSETRFGAEKSSKNAQRTDGNDNNIHRIINEFNTEQKSPAFRSDVQKSVKNIPDTKKIGTQIHHRTGEDVLSHFDRKNLAGCKIGVERSTDNINNTHRNENNVDHRTDEDALSNFDRNNPAYWSERSIQLLRQKCSEQFGGNTTRIIGSDDDFLLNRKSVDVGHNFDRKSPAYVSDRGARKVKLDVLERSGLKNLFQKAKKTLNHQDKDSAETSSFSSGSASSSTSTSIERSCPAYFSERNFTQNQKTVSSNEELSRKRHHNLTKANFDKNKPAYQSERTFLEESRKKVFDRLKREGDKSGNR